MKRIITIGRPTHFRVTSSRNLTTCGMVVAYIDAAYDPRDVDCLRCMKTRSYKKAMGLDRASP